MTVDSSTLPLKTRGSHPSKHAEEEPTAAQRRRFLAYLIHTEIAHAYSWKCLRESINANAP